MMNTINIDLMPWQTEVIKDKTKYQVVFAARRTGKTRLAIAKTLIKAIECHDDNGTVIYISPYRQICGYIFECIKGVGEKLIRSSNYGKMEIILYNGCKIIIRSPESLYPFDFPFLLHATFDEMHPSVESAFNDKIKHELERANGTALFIGNPITDSSFFREIYEKGLDGRDPEWKSWKIEVTDNPFISKADLDFSRSYMGNALFSQEYEPV
jgi:hypothetical protein